MLNWPLRTVRDGALELKGSHSIGDGQIFLKTRRNVSFKKGLSNEPDPSFWTVPLKGDFFRFLSVWNSVDEIYPSSKRNIYQPNLFSPVLFWSYWARAAGGQSAEVQSLPQPLVY